LSNLNTSQLLINQDDILLNDDDDIDLDDNDDNDRFSHTSSHRISFQTSTHLSLTGVNSAFNAVLNTIPNDTAEGLSIAEDDSDFDSQISFGSDDEMIISDELLSLDQQQLSSQQQQQKPSMAHLSHLRYGMKTVNTGLTITEENSGDDDDDDDQ
jgi:hypothetical protein